MQEAQLAHRSGIERLRKPVSFLIAAILLVLLVITRPAGFESVAYEMLEQAGFLMVFVAVLGRIWCTLYIAGRKNRQLCMVGPYAVCRNPLYLFSFIGLVGICFAAENLVLALVSAAAYLMFYRGVIRGEERRLAELFGADFDRYVARTPRFWPRLRIPGNAGVLNVDSRIFTSSLLEVIWFLVAINLVEIIEWVKIHQPGFGITLPW
jgi:protein-S-isoprenylcysteine O-methyltransferase Ste14